MTDEALLEAFLAKTIPLEEWDHRKHLRLAWIHLRDYPPGEATDLMRTRIQEFNAAKGIEDALTSGYHETMTQAWMRLIDFTMRQSGDGGNSDAFFDAQPHLTQKTLMRLYYSRHRIITAEAKAEFLEPDLAPFPVAGSRRG